MLHGKKRSSGIGDEDINRTVKEQWLKFIIVSVAVAVAVAIAAVAAVTAVAAVVAVAAVAAVVAVELVFLRSEE